VWPEREIANSATTPGRFAGDHAGPGQVLDNGYDWKKCEAKLNAAPMFITNIDGLDIHFIHVKSKHKNALPSSSPRMAGIDHRTDEIIGR